jgi:hypothetical protein
MSDELSAERDLIARLDAVNTEELIDLLLTATEEEERVLRSYLGQQRYQRMRGMAMKRRMAPRGTQLTTKRKGNVVVIHGILGSELSVINPKNAMDLLWLSYWRMLGLGWFNRLLLGDDGLKGDYDVRATGIMKKYYGELILTLSENWNTRAFWYDWRKDLNVAADELRAQISSWFGEDTPVHIVSHSMGGLVSRTFIKRHPKRWATMWDKASNGKAGGRLIMLGTPNHGSFDIPQIITGLEPTVRKLAKYDLRHGLRDVLRIVNSFVGPFQMLPSPLAKPDMKKLYKAETYGELNVSQRLLDNAQKHHALLSDVVHPDRMVYIAGFNRTTFSDILDMSRIGFLDSYDVTQKGDGRVTHELGLLRTKTGQSIQTYYLEETHGDLPNNRKLLSVMGELLETGMTKALHEKPVSVRGAEPETQANKERLRADLVADREKDVETFAVLSTRLSRSPRELGPDSTARRTSLYGSEVDLTLISRGIGPTFSTRISAEEIAAEESIVRGFLGVADGQGLAASEDESDEPLTFEIALVSDGIEDIHKRQLTSTQGNVLDVIAVGHYLGVKPQAAELKLDHAISRDLPGKVAKKESELSDSDLILTQYTERGIIRGDLGQPFFMNDPRRTNGPDKNRGIRTIAIAGMGVPGRFGVPELTVTVRELCWSLGRMGKRHLATVLIGSGNGNLSVRDSVAGWISGITHAISGSPQDDQRRLRRITFVENDPRKLREIQEAIVYHQDLKENGARLKIKYKGYAEDELRRFEPRIKERNEAELNAQRGRSDKSRSPVPIRVTLQYSQGTYRFAAITENASIPERDITIDPALVMRANQELAAEGIPTQQLERGRFMEKLLIHNDLRQMLSSNAPMVMMLDSTTARIHWEALAQSDPFSSHLSKVVEYGEYFLGTARGFTRQLRTMFGPPPEPPPPPRRVLRVLVVADPAANAPLAGAQEEGLEVAELFESFNTVWNLRENRVEVVRLFGPGEATRTNVLTELMLRSYDVLHFAGHCFYNNANPSASGWVFGKDEFLTANELNRIDRVPKFIFSNACESGVTPERAQNRSIELAPSFAEAFFKQGVSNFVCTAWPVDDLAARQFAVTLYSNLLGLSEIKDQANRYERNANGPEFMHVAMRQARLMIASTAQGVRTWAAYQHYGNPYLRLFDEDSMRGGSGGDTDAKSKAQQRTKGRSGPAVKQRKSRRKTRGE